MFRDIFRFEIGYHLRRPSTYLFFGILFLIALVIMASEATTGGLGTRVLRNSPFLITEFMIDLTAIGMVITAALAGTAVLRDYDHQMHELLFTTPITKPAFLGGRLAGGLVAMLLVYSAIPLGFFIGTLMPWVDPEGVAPFVLLHYLSPSLIFLLPNVLFISALFFAAGVLLRSHFAIYTIGFVVLTGDLIAKEPRKGLDSQWITALTDVFGRSTFELVTRYWTPVERNALTVEFAGPVLLNRIFWMGVGALLIGVAYLAFRFELAPRSLRRRRASNGEVGAGIHSAPVDLPPEARLDFGLPARWGQVVSLARFHFQGIVRTVPFLAIVVIMMANIAIGAWQQAGWYDTRLYPVTYYMIEVMGGGNSIFFILLLTIFAGELVWRERALRADQLADTLPASSSQIIAGKLLGFSGALAVAIVAGILVTIANQLARGYTHLEIGLYLRWLFLIEYPSLLAFTLFAFFVHTVLNHKYLGHLVMLIFYLALPLLANLGFEHSLYRFGLPAGFTYSDMNGFGHFVPRLAWFTFYWLGFGLVFLGIASLFWVRGTDTGYRHKLRRVRARLTPRFAAFGTGALLVTLLCGATIFHNTTTLNRYETRSEKEARLADYEHRYRGYLELDQPRIAGMRFAVDLFPGERSYRFAGTYTLVNRHDRAIDTLYVSLAVLGGRRDLTLDSLVWDQATELLVADSTHGVFLYRLAEPLGPGDTLDLSFGLTVVSQGFPNGGTNTTIVGNGSFINLGIGPRLGYDETAELQSPDSRRKEGLPPRDRMPPLTDQRALQRNQLTGDADWVMAEAVVSTAPDQIAIAPGYLEREWLEDGRRYFHYLTDAPILKFFSVLSARYELYRDQWVDPASGEAVAIEISYHPGHEYNLERMASSIKRSLDYYTRAFAPYQFRQIRIVEFPRYQSSAQSFPSTIPYSEGIGFVTRVGDDDDIDMPFFVTAHEVAHQWWGHQVIGANVQGSSIIVESLAEYSALMVMEHEYGREMTHRFLRHELDRYLRGRASERIREQPLITTENQPYIHYYKGALALYALRDQIGEDQLNGALAKFLHKYRYPTPPYPTSLDLVAELRAATPDSLQYLITDLFETITLWDHKVETATVREREDGEYLVSLTVHARKLRADSLGTETEIALGDWVDIGVFGQGEPGNRLGRPLYLAKHRITEPVTTIEVVVDELPLRAGIDPYNKLIDREPKDNVREVTRH